MSETNEILNKVRESFSLVRQDIERLDAAFNRLSDDSTAFQNESVNTIEVLNKRQKLIESSTPKLIASHGISLHSMLKVNKAVIALKQTLDAIGKQNENLANDNKKLRKELQQMQASINKKFAAMDKDIKKRVMKSRPKKKKR